MESEIKKSEKYFPISSLLNGISNDNSTSLKKDSLLQITVTSIEYPNNKCTNALPGYRIILSVNKLPDNTFIIEEDIFKFIKTEQREIEIPIKCEISPYGFVCRTKSFPKMNGNYKLILEENFIGESFTIDKFEFSNSVNIDVYFTEIDYEKTNFQKKVDYSTNPKDKFIIYYKDLFIKVPKIVNQNTKETINCEINEYSLECPFDESILPPDKEDPKEYLEYLFIIYDACDNPLSIPFQVLVKKEDAIEIISYSLSTGNICVYLDWSVIITIQAKGLSSLSEEEIIEDQIYLFSNFQLISLTCIINKLSFTCYPIESAIDNGEYYLYIENDIYLEETVIKNVMLPEPIEVNMDNIYPDKDKLISNIYYDFSQGDTSFFEITYLSEIKLLPSVHVNETKTTLSCDKSEKNNKILKCFFNKETFPYDKNYPSQTKIYNIIFDDICGHEQFSFKINVFKSSSSSLKINFHEYSLIDDNYCNKFSGELKLKIDFSIENCNVTEIADKFDFSNKVFLKKENENDMIELKCGQNEQIIEKGTGSMTCKPNESELLIDPGTYVLFIQSFTTSDYSISEFIGKKKIFLTNTNYIKPKKGSFSNEINYSEISTEYFVISIEFEDELKYLPEVKLVFNPNEDSVIPDDYLVLYGCENNKNNFKILECKGLKNIFVPNEKEYVFNVVNVCGEYEPDFELKVKITRSVAKLEIINDEILTNDECVNYQKNLEIVIFFETKEGKLEKNVGTNIDILKGRKDNSNIIKSFCLQKDSTSLSCKTISENVINDIYKVSIDPIYEDYFVISKYIGKREIGFTDKRYIKPIKKNYEFIFAENKSKDDYAYKIKLEMEKEISDSLEVPKAYLKNNILEKDLDCNFDIDNRKLIICDLKKDEFFPDKDKNKYAKYEFGLKNICGFVEQDVNIKVFISKEEIVEEKEKKENNSSSNYKMIGIISLILIFVVSLLVLVVYIIRKNKNNNLGGVDKISFVFPE